MNFRVHIPCSKPKLEEECGGTYSITTCMYPAQSLHGFRMADPRIIDLYPTVWATNR